MVRKKSWIIAACSLAAGIALVVLLEKPSSDGDATPATQVTGQDFVVYSWDRLTPDDLIVHELKARTSPKEFRQRAPELSLAFRQITIEWIGPRDRELVEHRVAQIYEELRQEINNLSPECGDKTIIVWLYPQCEIGIVPVPALVVDERADPELKPWDNVSGKQWMTHRYNKSTDSFADPF